jgi:Leucine-rich repeat (LRR) protein
LQNLTDLDLGRNGINELPAFVKDLPKLRVLGLEWNEFKIVPPIISNLRELRTLKLEANDLNDLPDFLNKLPHLSQISLGYNCKITQNPSKVKSLKRRFPNITFDFTDEYDCPAERPV